MTENHMENEQESKEETSAQEVQSVQEEHPPVNEAPALKSENGTQEKRKRTRKLIAKETSPVTENVVSEVPEEKNPSEQTEQIEVPSPEISGELPGEVKVSTEAPAEHGTDNHAFVNNQIDKLISLREEKNFSDFWFYVKELNKMIFTLRGLQKEERLTFKKRIGELCEDVKKAQDEFKAHVAKTSQIKLEAVKKILDEALTYGTTPEELEKSFQKIEEGSKFLREGIVKAEDGEESGDMSREDREKAKEEIKKAKDAIFDRKRNLRENNFKSVTDRLNKISDNLIAGRAQGVFNAIKKLRADMKQMTLDRSQLREIDNVIETIWKKGVQNLHAGRENDTKQKMTELEWSIKKKEQFIQTLHKEIKDLNEKWSNVKNDFFKNRVNEWIEEKKEKIDQTGKEIESIKDKIKFLGEQLQRN